MAARTIVTFHPDVACDMCGRRLLRGEQPDVFVGGGQRRMVCELCTRRATHEGWSRATEEGMGGASAERSQRGRSLLGKLRQSRRSSPERPAWNGPETAWGAETEMIAQPETESRAEPRAAEPATEELGTEASGDLSVRRALAVFNASEQPRRVLGVARSLGAPCVRAARVAEASAVVRIVVAWELCWYRYEVDLEDESGGALLAAEGMELEELAAEDRVANAAADERGELSLLVA